MRAVEETSPLLRTTIRCVDMINKIVFISGRDIPPDRLHVSDRSPYLIFLHPTAGNPEAGTTSCFHSLR